MHPLHDYVAKQLADKLKDRRVVVWYDERGEFGTFVNEVRGGPRMVSEPGAHPAFVARKTSLPRFSGRTRIAALPDPFVLADFARIPAPETRTVAPAIPCRPWAETVTSRRVQCFRRAERLNATPS